MLTFLTQASSFNETVLSRQSKPTPGEEVDQQHLKMDPGRKSITGWCIIIISVPCKFASLRIHTQCMYREYRPLAVGVSMSVVKLAAAMLEYNAWALSMGLKYRILWWPIYRVVRSITRFYGNITAAAM